MTTAAVRFQPIDGLPGEYTVEAKIARGVRLTAGRVARFGPATWAGLFPGARAWTAYYPTRREAAQAVLDHRTARGVQAGAL